MKKYLIIILIAIILLTGIYGTGAFWFRGPTFFGDVSQNMYIGNGSGLKISGVAGENITAGHVCYLSDDDQIWLTDADSSDNSTGLLVLALADVSASASGVFLTYGYAENSNWSWNESAILYLSTSSGNMTETAPSGSGDIVRIIGYGIDAADTIWFDPDKSWVELE